MNSFIKTTQAGGKRNIAKRNIKSSKEKPAHYSWRCSMKLAIKVVSVLFASACISAGSITPKKKIACNSVTTLSHFLDSENLTQDIRVMCQGGDLTLTVKLYVASTDALVVTKTYNETLTKDVAKIISVALNTKYRLKNTGLKIEYNFNYDNRTFSTSGVIYPFSKQSVDVSYNKSSPITFNGVLLNMKQNKITTDETFDFKDTSEYLSVNEKNAIDFTEIGFLYNNLLDLPYESIEYHIKDYENIFPDIHKENNEVVVKLKAVQNGENITLDYNDDLYVNPNDNHMSSTPAADSIKSQALYLPVGKEKLFENDDSYILIKSGGYSETDFTIPLRFYLDKKFIGQCYEADYCISGGVKE